jgi:hypothetical protein
MSAELNPKIIKLVCYMFKLTDKQLDLLEGPFMLIARPVLAIVGLTVVAYWLLTDIGIPALIKAVQK